MTWMKIETIQNGRKRFSNRNGKRLNQQQNRIYVHILDFSCNISQSWMETSFCIQFHSISLCAHQQQQKKSVRRKSSFLSFPHFTSTNHPQRYVCYVYGDDGDDGASFRRDDVYFPTWGRHQRRPFRLLHERLRCDEFDNSGHRGSPCEKLERDGDDDSCCA